MRLLKVIILLAILILAGLVGYAYLGDMDSAPQEMRMPVELDLSAAPPPVTAAPATAEPAAAEPVQPAADPAGAADQEQHDPD